MTTDRFSRTCGRKVEKLGGGISTQTKNVLGSIHPCRRREALGCPETRAKTLLMGVLTRFSRPTATLMATSGVCVARPHASAEYSVCLCNSALCICTAFTMIPCLQTLHAAPDPSCACAQPTLLKHSLVVAPPPLGPPPPQTPLGPWPHSNCSHSHHTSQLPGYSMHHATCLYGLHTTVASELRAP